MYKTVNEAINDAKLVMERFCYDMVAVVTKTKSGYGFHFQKKENQFAPEASNGLPVLTISATTQYWIK